MSTHNGDPPHEAEQPFIEWDAATFQGNVNGRDVIRARFNYYFDPVRDSLPHLSFGSVVVEVQKHSLVNGVAVLGPWEEAANVFFHGGYPTSGMLSHPCDLGPINGPQAPFAVKARATIYDLEYWLMFQTEQSVWVQSPLNDEGKP